MSLLLKDKIGRELPGNLRVHLAPFLSGGRINDTYMLLDRCWFGSLLKIFSNRSSVVFIARQSILVLLIYEKSGDFLFVCLFFPKLSNLSLTSCSSRLFCRREEILSFVAATLMYLFKELVPCWINTTRSSLNIQPRIILKSRNHGVGNISALTERLIWSTLIIAFNYGSLF